MVLPCLIVHWAEFVHGSKLWTLYLESLKCSHFPICRSSSSELILDVTSYRLPPTYPRQWPLFLFDLWLSWSPPYILVIYKFMVWGFELLNLAVYAKYSTSYNPFLKKVLNKYYLKNSKPLIESEESKEYCYPSLYAKYGKYNCTFPDMLKVFSLLYADKK